jgi:hypothetical protein
MAGASLVRPFYGGSWSPRRPRNGFQKMPGYTERAALSAAAFGPDRYCREHLSNPNEDHEANVEELRASNKEFGALTRSRKAPTRSFAPKKNC